MTTEAKCNCQHCGGNIEFPAEMAGQTTNCPMCQLETLLAIPPVATPSVSDPQTQDEQSSWLFIAAALSKTFQLGEPLVIARSCSEFVGNVTPGGVAVMELMTGAEVAGLTVQII